MIIDFIFDTFNIEQFGYSCLIIIRANSIQEWINYTVTHILIPENLRDLFITRNLKTIDVWRAEIHSTQSLYASSTPHNKTGNNNAENCVGAEKRELSTRSSPSIETEIADVSKEESRSCREMRGAIINSVARR